MNFCEYRKHENSVLNSVFKHSAQISSPPIFSPNFAFIEFSELRIKARSPTSFFESSSENVKQPSDILIVKILPVLLQRLNITIEESNHKSNFCQFQTMRVQMQQTCFGICLSNNPTRKKKNSSDALMKEVPTVTLETDELDWSLKKNHTQMEVLEFSTNQASAESNNI